MLEGKPDNIFSDAAVHGSHWVLYYNCNPVQQFWPQVLMLKYDQVQVSADGKTLIYYSPVAWSSFLTYWPLVLSGVWFWFQSKQKHSGPCLVGLLGYLSSIFLKIKHQLHLSHTIARVAFAFTIKRKYWYNFETKHKMTTLWEVSFHASGDNKNCTERSIWF